jgi:hypothetical protein
MSGPFQNSLNFEKLYLLYYIFSEFSTIFLKRSGAALKGTGCLAPESPYHRPPIKGGRQKKLFCRPGGGSGTEFQRLRR